MIITSLLDTDLYKFTMMQAVQHQFPGAQVEYRFKCRNPGIQLAVFVDEIREEIRSLCSLHFQESELAYLRSMRFIKSDFVDFLGLFRLNEKYVTVTPLPSGEIDISIVGPWLHTILFEIPVLAIVNEVYYRNIQKLPDFAEDRKRLRDIFDEIKNRLKLIGELRIKLKQVGVDEVHELQPLFERGLWMFGAQFESIEFTSNKGMTHVIKTIFRDVDGKGTRNRPDFVALPDSSVGFYARASYDENHDEDGVDHLVIIDLKTTGLALGNKEKDQVWKYVKELREKGYLKKYTRVDGFVLGDKIEPNENDPTTHGAEVKISPLLYDTLLIRAEKRLLNLHKKVKNAPFLVAQQEALKKFLEPITVIQSELR